MEPLLCKAETQILQNSTFGFFLTMFHKYVQLSIMPVGFFVLTTFFQAMHPSITGICWDIRNIVGCLDLSLASRLKQN